MLNNANTKMIYSKIQKQLFYMIPEKWDSIYLYASVIERVHHLETGELFFYYFPKGIFRKNPVNSYEIPAKFNLDEEGYVKLAEKLYSLIKQLKKEFKKSEEELWNSLTIKVENFHFIVEFYYDNESRDEEEQHLIWGYKNLKFPIESYTKRERQIIMQYLQQEVIHPSRIKIYTEPMYRNPIKNVVQYNREQSEFITQDQVDKLEQSEKISNNIHRFDNEKQYSALPKEYNYTYNKKKNKPLRESKIVKKKINSELFQSEVEPQLKLEEQIEQQRNSVKSQILNHN